MVRAEKAGYRPLDATFEVTSDVRQIARFRLELLPTLLAVEIEPASGVRVFVDGAEQGRTPLSPLELAPGDHDVALRAEGYATHTTRVTARGGGETQVLRATLAPDRARVRITSEPGGADVRVDGVVLGITPLGVDLSSGVRSVTR